MENITLIEWLGKLAYSLSGLNKNLNPPQAAKYELSN